MWRRIPIKEGIEAMPKAANELRKIFFNYKSCKRLNFLKIVLKVFVVFCRSVYKMISDSLVLNESVNKEDVHEKVWLSYTNF
ncbi:hypothetical protein, partial [Ectobacillus funiculus]|uniref:hypothetical protein n=1 Tax=Ectobacillus funiculus TaxID=137993 RepID=UPI00196AFD58